MAKINYICYDDRDWGHVSPSAWTLCNALRVLCTVYVCPSFHTSTSKLYNNELVIGYSLH